MPTASRTGGFTLVELMITIAIVAILAALALPSFQGMIRSNRVATTTNEFNAFVAYARSEALRNSGGAVLCASATGTSCGGTWDQGWLLFGDRDGEGDLDPTDPVLRVSGPRTGVALTMTGGQVRFDPRGRLIGGARTMQFVPQSYSTPVKCMTIRTSGQASVAQTAC